MTKSRISLFGASVFICSAVLFPNSFGNNPDLIQDESYFLTSSLSALQKGTLPGWEFSPSGAYYGGIQTYLDTLALVPIIGIIFITSHFSLAQTEVWIALHTGDLLQALRIVNGLLVLAAIAFFALYFIRRRVPRALGESATIFLFLILGNSLVFGFLHTAKVWPLALIIDAALGVLFLANEYYLSHFKQPFLPKERYVALLVWGAALAFFQNFIGIYSACLWILYSIFLGHFALRDVGAYLLKRWYWFVLLTLTQISFVYRGLIARAHPSFLDPAGNSTMTATGIDWFHRLLDPIGYVLVSQPLAFLFLVGLTFLLVHAPSRTELFSLTRRGRYFLIACLHPLLTFFFYYGLIGFSLFPRYSVMLAIALSFSTVMLLSEHARARTSVLVISGMLFFLVGAQAIMLYWQPSSAVQLERTIARKYNESSQVFIITPSASRLALPLNADSLALLNDRRKAQTRFQFLLANLSLVPDRVSFASLVLFADTPAEETLLLARFATSTSAVWTVSQDCTRACTSTEIEAGSCFMVNASACTLFSSDDQKEYPVISLFPYLSQTGLGVAYIVRKVHE